MKPIIAALLVAATLAAPPALARKKPIAAWQVMRATDPITKASTCAVVASDYVGKMRFTRSGGMYPVVELNSVHGLLVGVSSGGRFRLPTGDILWVVDDLPHREILAADNPGLASPQTPDAPRSTVETATAQTLRLTYAMTATSTMASGEKAREMLDEMRAGRSLLFRPAAPAVQMGLPNYTAMMAGQVNEKGQVRAIPLDASLHAGLLECGIVKSAKDE